MDFLSRFCFLQSPFQCLCKDKNLISAVTIPVRGPRGSRLHEVITANRPAVIERLHLVNTSTGTLTDRVLCITSLPTSRAHDFGTTVSIFIELHFDVKRRAGPAKHLSGTRNDVNERCFAVLESKLEARCLADEPNPWRVRKKLKYPVDLADSIEKHQHPTNEITNCFDVPNATIIYSIVSKKGGEGWWRPCS